MARLQTRAEIEYGAILLFKVAPLLMAVLLALQINPEISLVIPITFTNQLFIFLISLVSALALIEAGAGHAENRGSRGGRLSPSGFTFPVIVALVLAVIGFAFSLYIGITNYEYNNAEINTYLSYYLGIGAVMIFIYSREDIFLHTALLSKFAGR